VRGAFTGATGDRKGRFALAGKGTIFLDEIGDTSAEMQAKLLRVLQEREFYPVGAERPERTEARVIAATHRDLEQMQTTGAFRTDLYYRLRVVEIVVPPLRERADDIPLLARHLVRRASVVAGRTPPVLSDEAVSALRRHNWPGNVRELENCLTRAVLLATSDVIRAEHVELGMLRGESGANDVASIDPEHLPSLEDLERAHVERVFAATLGHKARAAAILGVSRPRLDRLLRKYGIA
jgi:two-component system response regulator AtoC